MKSFFVAVLMTITTSPVALAQDSGVPTTLPPMKKASDIPRVLEATLDLEWEEVEDAVGYEVKLTPKEGGAPLSFSAIGHRISQKLPVGIYKVQIRSKDRSTGYFGPWSEATEVEVTTKIVELIQPSNGAELSAPKDRYQVVQFKWSAAEGAKKYTIKIWSNDIDKAVEFVTSSTTKDLKLPTGRTYFWQVTFESENQVGYKAAPKVFTFNLLGPQLLQPIVNKKIGLPAVTKVSWSKSPHAVFYKTKILRHALDETEWQVMKEQDKASALTWGFDKLKPGAYRVEVSAHAPNRVSSEVGFYEFVVKPTEQELMAALKPALDLDAKIAAEAK